jgi:hypothetical protein
VRCRRTATRTPTRERRQRGRDVVIDLLPLAGLLPLEPLPVHEHLVGAGHLDLTEDVGVAMDQLADEPFGHIVDVPTIVLRRHLGMEGHLEQEIAELVTHRVVVAGIDRLEQLVRFLEQVAGQGRMGLLPVPRTPVGSSKSGLDLDQIEESLPLHRGRDGTRGNVGQRVVGHPVGAFTGVGETVGVAETSVLEIRRTAN